MRSEGVKVGRYGERRVDWDSVLRLGNRYASQTNSYEIAIHSLTIWARKLSEDEMEARFTKGVLKQLLFVLSVIPYVKIA